MGSLKNCNLKQYPNAFVPINFIDEFVVIINVFNFEQWQKELFWMYSTKEGNKNDSKDEQYEKALLSIDLRDDPFKKLIKCKPESKNALLLIDSTKIGILIELNFLNFSNIKFSIYFINFGIVINSKFWQFENALFPIFVKEESFEIITDFNFLHLWKA